MSKPVSSNSGIQFHSMDDHAFSLETRLVSTPLTGGNYIAWCQAMSLALQARNKLGFVDGTILKPSEGDPKLSSWKESNHLVLSWITNSIHEDLMVPSTYKDEEVFAAAAADVWSDLRDRFSPTSGLRVFDLQRAIATHKQDIGDSAVAYFNKFKILCDDLSNCLSTTASCSACGATDSGPRQQVQLLMQFLMGLHEDYDLFRRKILQMIPLPSVDDAYALLLLEDETQHDELGRPKNDATVLAPTKSNHDADHGRCDCNISAHTIETRNELLGDHAEDHDAKQECLNLFDLITSFTIATKSRTERKMEIKHFSHEHSLSLNNVKDSLYKCEGCLELLMGPVYSCNLCSSNQKSYVLDELCARLTRKISHPAHPQHPLILLLKPPTRSGNIVCAACGCVCEAFRFCCPICQFYLDIQCASMPSALRHKFHPHRLTLGPSSISPSDCGGCGLPIRGVSFSCSDCIYDLHVPCATLAPTINRGRRRRRPTLYLSSTNYSGDKSLCSVCCKMIDRPSWFYCSKDDGYLIHVKCLGLLRPNLKWNSEDRRMWSAEPAPQRDLQVTMKLAKKSSKTEEKKKNGEENHEHRHPLVLVNEIERTKSFCSWCQQLLSGPTYGCKGCNHYLHGLCYKSPRTKNHPFHPNHALTLTPRIAGERLQGCKACNNLMVGNFYRCEACKTNLLHAECSSLPHQVTVTDIHEHPLSLLYAMKDDGSNEHYCWVCEERLYENWSYYCDICSCSIHLACVTYAALPLRTKDWPMEGRLGILGGICKSQDI